LERLEKLPRKIAVRAILLEETNHVLLVKRAEGTYAEGKWCLPGGKVDSGEGKVAAVRRETFEEIGIDFKPDYFKGIENPDVSSGVKWLTHYFVGKIPEDYQGDGLNLRENSAVAFWSEGELNLLDIAFDHKEVLEEFFNSLRLKSS
jgi:mutator protein MutT